MKKTLLLRKEVLAAASLAALAACSPAFTPEVEEPLNPVASADATVVEGNARFTVLTPEMIRIEYSDSARFDDRASFVVVNRQLPVPEFTTERTDSTLSIVTDKLNLTYRLGTDPRTSADNLTVTLKLNGEDVSWHPGLADSLNLKGTFRTLDSEDGDNHRGWLENGVISRSGWAVIDDSWQHRNQDGSHTLRFEPNEKAGFDWVAAPADTTAMDTYFLGYGHDYKKAIGDFTKIAGKVPMPPHYIFGYWYSKFHRYTQQDFVDLVNDMIENDVPADVMIIDTDWHINNWTGWTWNEELIPDPKGLLKFMHDNGLHVSLNLHPAFGIESNEENFDLVCQAMELPDTTSHIDWLLDNPDFYRAMFDNVIRNREADGVDFWWLDWQQWMTNPRVDGLGETFWNNYVFFNDMKKNRPDRRPVIFHRWGGLGSHRYQIGFSGDTYSNFPTLAFEPYFTATASNVCYGYWGHDLGGHLQHGDNDPELYLRWIQYGVFTPIFRTHSANFPNIERRMWKYPNFDLMRNAVKLRYALFPYIYTASRQCYDSGISICRPLYYEYPELEVAYNNENEYFFGDDILVAPVVEPADSVTGISAKNVWLPEGGWWCPDLAKMIESDGKDEIALEFTQAQIPYFIRRGAIIPMYPDGIRSVTARPDMLVLNIVAGKDGQKSTNTLYEDEGDNDNYRQGKYALTDFTQTVDGGKSVFTVEPVRGSFEGMKQNRAYKLNVFDIARPTSVSVNGSKVDNWTYDEATRTLSLETPSVATSKRLTVEVK